MSERTPYRHTDERAIAGFLINLHLKDFKDLVKVQAANARDRAEYERLIPVWQAQATRRVGFMAESHKLTDMDRVHASDELATFLVGIQVEQEVRFGL